ncbi:MAG TPA: hypothetical protein VGP80_02005 [Gemmatimonadales bacterium]|jgi:hypothetical protein|nr:hypothetical protein [Gemmatimonadales bacterium]
MATRTERATSRIANGIRKGSKAAAEATWNLTNKLDRVSDTSERFSSPGKVRRAKRALAQVAKAAAVSAIVTGVRKAGKAALKKADALEARHKPKSRMKTAAKAVGIAAAVAGAVVLARRARKK